MAATGHNLKISGQTEITLQIKGLLIPHTFLVVEGLFPSLLVGTDYLSKNSAFINYADNTVRFYDSLIVVPLQGFNTVNNCATIKQTACIPKYSEAIISVQIPKFFRGNEVILESLSNNLSPVLIGGSLTTVSNDNTGHIRVLNYKPYTVVLRRKTKIAKILYPDKVASIVPFQTPEEGQKQETQQSPEVLEQFIKEYKIDINPHLSPKERYELLSLFYEYKDIFARDFKDIRVYKDFELELQLRDPNARCYTRQYPLRRDEILEADRQITELHQRGLIEENKDCTFNSPIFLVRKKDGSLRMVQDLRKLNSLL